MEKFLYSDADLKDLNETGYELYQIALESSKSEDWYKAGEIYDLTYTGAWGDLIFSGIKVGTYEFKCSPLYLGLQGLIERQQEEFFEEMLSTNKRKLVVSCEFYLKALEIDANHFYANIQLATALTAALQVFPACTYWEKSLRLNSKTALKALSADLMAKYHRRVATELVATVLEDDKSKITDMLNRVRSNEYFIEQVVSARSLLSSSPYISSKIYKD